MSEKLTVDELAEKIVRDDVYCNIGSLVEFSIKMSYDGHDAPITYEDLETAGPNFFNMADEDLIEWIKENVTTDQDLAELDNDELIQICQDNYDEVEVYEYWAVSGWLAEKLTERGEIVIDNYPHVWGRQTTGQAITLDGVIRNIAKYLYEL